MTKRPARGTFPTSKHQSIKASKHQSIKASKHQSIKASTKIYRITVNLERSPN